ncbi:hypothetical protein JTE90_005392 [Oedothorax gibbosus]|uniref:Uncharacterized protein n=1 Tax=Oedothorax gibbosus TaxID=931172 RepID=A0AAV6V696_9ARAC|nr:hypothetical protein JTE90_005392 [Oedothorax gibbosus]
MSSKEKEQEGEEQRSCDRCHRKNKKEDDKKIPSNMTDKSQQTRIGYDKSQDHQQWRYASNGRRPSSRQSLPADGTSRGARQANIVCTKHEKEKVKMQATIEKLQEAFCDKESKLQDTKSQLVRERRMSEIMERQLKNARNLSEQLGRIIYDREQEIRTLKNMLGNKRDPSLGAAASREAARASRRRSTSKDDFQGAMRRSSSTSDHTDCPSLSSTSVDKMLKEVHSLIDGLKIKDEAIKGLQEECTRRLDKIQILQRSIQVLQDQLTQSSQQHNSASVEKENLISQLQHSLKEAESTVQSLLSEKSQVAIEGENTIQELQEMLQQKDLLVKRVQGQLEEALETKETELQQMRDALEARQRDLDAKHRDLEEANEELFRSQMEGEALKSELNQEKCSLSKMSEEINSLVDKLSTALQEMESVKLEHSKKEERLKHAQEKVQEMYAMFLSDQDVQEKMQHLYSARREHTGRKVLSEEDVLEKIMHPKSRRHFRTENKGKFGTNQQIHKQQLSELQQQVTDSQAVCGILQEQLKEVTDFLDQLLHIDISPKNLSLIKHYGMRHLTDNSMLTKERIAPDGISSNSQLDIEFSRQGTFEDDDANQRTEPSSDLPTNYIFEPVHHGSFQAVGSLYDQQSRQHLFATHRSASAENFNDSGHLRSASASDITLPTKDPSEMVPVSVSIQGASSDSDEILLLLNDREVSQQQVIENNISSSDTTQQQTNKKLSRPAPVSPPFPRGLKITENYGSDGSINTRDTSAGNCNVLERSVSFGSFSDSVLMSYDQSERGASDESSGKVNIRCIRSIDMMDLIPVGGEGADPTRQVAAFLTSDSDIWSEPDTTLSRQRMGLCVEETDKSSDYSTTCVSDDDVLRRSKVQSRCESRRSRNVVHVPPNKKTANKVKRWLEKLKNYLRMFEEANFHLTDEINNLCDVRSQMSAILTVEGKVDNSEAILFDLAEYIRLNFLMQKKLEKSIHFNRQLIDVFQKNISCQKKPMLDNIPVKQTPTRHPSRQKRQHPSRKANASPPPFIDDNHPSNMQMMPYESPEIHNQLLGYHSTLMSCQEMIKDLHTQLKDRHCSEIVNKHELNRTVYGYLEDIDHCIDDLCKKMETSSDTQGYCFKPQFVRSNTDPQAHQEDPIYENHFVPRHSFPGKLQDNDQRLQISTENALQLQQQLGGIKRSLYEIQVENLELKECLEGSKQQRMEGIEDSQNVEYEYGFDEEGQEHSFHNGDVWQNGTERNGDAVETYGRGWESEDY